MLLESYGRLDESRAEVIRPGSVAELADAMAICARSGRRASFRAAGHSFHDQSLNDDAVISMERLDRILEIDPARQLITVEPGVTWGRIVDAALEHDLVPYVVVTTAHATAGGTLASDGISRHSPSYGSESAHVESFDLLAPAFDGPRTVHRPGTPGTPRTPGTPGTPRTPGPGEGDENAALYRGVIGGFGYLGAVTRITYRLLSVRDVGGGKSAGPLQVATRLTTVESFRELVAAQLGPTADLAGGRGELETWEFPAAADEAAPAVYSVSFLHRGDGRGAVYRSFYTRGQEPNPYFVFRVRSRLRVAVDIMASYGWSGSVGRRIAWELMRRSSRRGTMYIDDARDFLFFMDGNVKAKDVATRLRLGLPVIQQTFVIPTDRTAKFLDEIPELLGAHRVEPTLFDVLYMPRDSITMSASRGMEGFACTLAFEDIRRPSVRARVIAALEQLSERCLAHGGRLHLTKNVYASPEVLAAMYGPQLEEIMQLKRRLDPTMLLQNAFFERAFAAPLRAWDRSRSWSSPRRESPPPDRR